MKCSKRFKEEALKLSDEIGVKKAATQRWFTGRCICRRRLRLDGGYWNFGWDLTARLLTSPVYFDDTVIELENTGTHADCFESEMVDKELVWL